MAKTHSVLSGMPRFAAAVSFVFVFPQFAPPDAPAAVGLGTFGLMGFIFAGATDARRCEGDARRGRSAPRGWASAGESRHFLEVYFVERGVHDGDLQLADDPGP